MNLHGHVLVKILVALIIFGATAYGVVYLDMVYSTEQEDRSNVETDQPPKVRVVEPPSKSHPPAKDRQPEDSKP
jgi:hypothetical protein